MAAPENRKDPSNIFWRYCTLGARVEDVSPTAFSDEDYRRPLANWHQFRRLWTEDDPRHHHFVDGLSAPQRRSASILIDWFDGLHQSEAINALSRRFLEGNKPLPNTFPGRKTLKADLGSGKSSYQRRMLDLFFFEFDFRSWDCEAAKGGQLDFQMSWIVRLEASKHAAAQTLAFPIFNAEEPTDEVDLGCRLLPPSTLHVCYWLTNSNRDPPIYLWNIKEKSTVKVNDLGVCPPYTCISHTWGRLRYGKKPYSYTDVPGVPWAVPRISRYDVRDLPQIFVQQSWKTEFLWIDLFCIPQVEAMRAERDDEVARQSSIFVQSTECVVWLNDIENPWTTVQSALRWLSYRYLSDHTVQGIYDTAEVFEELHNTPQANIELITAPDCSSVLKYALWFSSAWALQETFLCPQMILANRNWVPIQGPNRTIILLDSLISLVDVCGKRFQQQVT